MSIKDKGLKWAKAGLFLLLGLGIPWAGAAGRDQVRTVSSELQRLDEAMPGILMDLRYAGPRNITHKPIYNNQTAWLQPETIRRLKGVQTELKRQGYQLLIWDAYRPPAAQKALWAACPNANYLAPPTQGSRHTRGTSVDVSMVDLAGHAVEMPSDHDTFGPTASQDFAHVGPTARKHGLILRTAMYNNHFTGVPAEWWHYDLADWPKYPLINDPDPVVTQAAK